MDTVSRLEEPGEVLDGRTSTSVDYGRLAHFGAAAQILRVGGHAHGFLAAGDDDFGIALSSA
jgi:hypothetical protein